MVTTKELIECLQGTMMPDVRQHYEEQLQKMNKILGFTPGLLQVVMMNELDMPIRQAGVIYLKNMVTQYWRDGGEPEEPGGEIPFNIHEKDREVIRELIVDAVVLAPQLVRVQLTVSIHQIIKHDFPTKWPDVVRKIKAFLEKSDMESWFGSLLCLYQLVKFYEYKKKEVRAPLDEAMCVFLPMMYQRVTHLLPDSSQTSILIQKTCLKIFFAYTQYIMSLKIVTKEVFAQWMEVIRHIVDAPIPRDADDLDDESKARLPSWKNKKWALHILVRVFERYGTTVSCSKEYTTFAKWYVKTFTEGILEMIMKILNGYHNKAYVSPRVLQLSLSYVEKGVGQVVTWKYLKVNAMSIIEKVVFPLLCHSNEDDELWQSDPAEYVKTKTDIYTDLVSPVTAAQGLLQSMVKKRKEILDKTMAFVVQALNANVDARQKDGIFHMIGTLGTILVKKPVYKEQMESMLVQYVFPEFTSPYGFLRARVLWLLQYVENIKFTQEDNLVKIVTFMQDSLLTDGELPVKVEAAIALASYLNAQQKSEQILEPRMRDIVKHLLIVIKETENEEVTNVLCKIVNTYGEQLSPVAADICTELAATFKQVIESEDGAEEKAITAMGLLGTIEAILNCMDENVEIMTSIEPVVLQVIGHILTNNIIDFYEEAFSLIYSLTSTRISSDLWRCYEMLYNIFTEDGYDYFTEMMPAFHNYIIVDTTGFLSVPDRVEAMLKICKTILTGDLAEDEEAHAAKLLEVVVLQCSNGIIPYVKAIMEVAVERLLKEVKTTELRTMLLQVVIAALYTAPDVVLPALQGTALPNSSVPILTHFVKQWVHDADCFFGLHDRKLCVLGFCTLLQLGPERLPILRDLNKDILPSIVVLFKGLKNAYAAKAMNEDSDDDDDSDEGEDSESEALDDDEDEIQEGVADYLEQLAEKEDSDEEDSDDDDEIDDLDETTLESYTTPLDKEDCEIDEYWTFKTVMQSIEGAMPEWYHALTQNLNDEQKKVLLEISTLADQRLAARESKKIEESGGYSFPETKVPTSFNFGGAFGS